MRDNIDTENGRLDHQQRQTDMSVVVPLHHRLLSHLHHVAQSSASGPLCPSVAAKGPGGKHGLSESFKRIVVRAGWDPMVVQGKGHRQFTKRSFHSLRHSFTSALAAKGVSEEVRMKLTGHASSDIHRKHTHLDATPLKGDRVVVRSTGGALMVKFGGQIARYEVMFCPSTERNPPNDQIDDDRIFALNHQRDPGEVKAGLHNKGAKE